MVMVVYISTDNGEMWICTSVREIYCGFHTALITEIYGFNTALIKEKFKVFIMQ